LLLTAFQDVQTNTCRGCRRQLSLPKAIADYAQTLLLTDQSRFLGLWREQDGFLSAERTKWLPGAPTLLPILHKKIEAGFLEHWNSPTVFPACGLGGGVHKLLEELLDAIAYVLLIFWYFPDQLSLRQIQHLKRIARQCASGAMALIDYFDPEG